MKIGAVAAASGGHRGACAILGALKQPAGRAGRSGRGVDVHRDR